MTIGFAILLDSSSHNFIRSVQLELHQNLGLRLARQSPHITIKVPFEINEMAPMVEYFDQLAEKMESFPIELIGFNHFNKRVIYLEVDSNSVLTRWHHQILRDLKTEFGLDPHEFEGTNVKFHASLVGVNDSDQFESVMNYLNRYFPNFRFQAKQLAIFYHLGGERGWIVNRVKQMGT